MTEQNATTADQAKQFARDHPYIAFGALLIPVTYGITGDPMTALFTGGIVAFGKEIADGFTDKKEDVATEKDSTDEH